jgi:hypothetical protein
MPEVRWHRLVLRGNQNEPWATPFALGRKAKGIRRPECNHP